MDAAVNPAVIHVVDDDEALRIALARLLTAAGHRVRTYGDTGQFLLHGIDSGPGCLLLDFHLPGPNGLELQEALANRGIELPIVFLSGRGDVPVAVRAMKAGAVDFLTKPARREELLAALRRALALDSRGRTMRAELEAWRARYGTLTAREAAVFHCVVAGQPNKVIAAELGMAVRTVKAHRAHVMTKMGARSLAELVHIAGRLRRAEIARVD